MAARHQRQSKHWERSSPAPRQLVPRVVTAASHQQQLKHWERSSRAPRVVIAARHKHYSKHWERSSIAPRQFVPQYNRLSIESERPSSTPRQFVPWYNRHFNDLDRPSPTSNNRHFMWRSSRHDVQSNRSIAYPEGAVFRWLATDLETDYCFSSSVAARHKRHSKHWERSSPAPRQFVPRVVMAARHKRQSKHWERSSPGPRQFVPRVVMAARNERHSKHWERSSPAQRQLDPRFNRFSIELERPSSTPMQFVPWYGRHSNDSERPSPTPNNTHSMSRSPRHDVQSTRSSKYPEGAVFRSLATGLENDNHFPSSVCLKQVSLEPTKKTGQNPSFVLMDTRLAKDNDEEGGNVSRRPWEPVAEKVWPDLLSCLENVRRKMKCQELEEVSPKLVARFGKNIFRGWLGRLSETTLGKLTKSFHTNVPTSYTEKIIREAVPKIGVEFEGNKDIYHVRFSDSTEKDSIISCKCTLNNDKKLELYKVKRIYQLGHMIINISCLEKHIDLRLMLSGKRILTALTDNEMQRISNLINSAVVDPEKKCGFRWPQTAHSQNSRYKVVGIWHTISEVYKSPSLMLEVRSAIRYNFDTATEKATKEVSLKLKGIVSELLAQKRERNSIYDMFKDTLGMIWEHSLCCEQFLSTTDYIEEGG